MLPPPRSRPGTSVVSHSTRAIPPTPMTGTIAFAAPVDRSGARMARPPGPRPSAPRCGPWRGPRAIEASGIVAGRPPRLRVRLEGVGRGDGGGDELDRGGDRRLAGAEEHVLERLVVAQAHDRGGRGGAVRTAADPAELLLGLEVAD